MDTFPLEVSINITEKNNWITRLSEAERDEVVNNILEIGFLVKNSTQFRIDQGDGCVREDIQELRDLILGKFVTSSIKGRLGEKAIYEWCKQDFSSEFVEDTAKKDHCGDCHVGEGVGIKVLIDSKVYTNPVPTHEIEKLKQDMDSTNIKLSILVSFRSSITGKKRWQLDRYNDGYILYLPHMGNKFDLISMGIQFLREVYSVEMSRSKLFLPYDFDIRCEEIMKGLEKLVDIDSEMNKHSIEILETKEKMTTLMSEFLRKTLKRSEIIKRHSNFIRKTITKEIKSLTNDVHLDSFVGETAFFEFLERKKDKKTELLLHLMTIIKKYKIEICNKDADCVPFPLKQAWEWNLIYQSRVLGVIQARKTSIWFIYSLEKSAKPTRQTIRNGSEMSIFEHILKMLCHEL
tara:strand:+ start:1906 stop:3120 length:1215 start_codon:yes stop_codon:yes gene_type:complete